jgi:hypothetical protein
MILTQALEPYEQAASPGIRQNGDIAMPACPGTSPGPLPASPALRLAASDGEAVPPSRADPDQPLGEVPCLKTLLDQLSFGSGAPNIARTCDALLGGKDNYSVDRLERARKVVAAWREANLCGTTGQPIADVGPPFHPESGIGIVFRGVLFAVDRSRARQVTSLAKEAAP